MQTKSCHSLIVSQKNPHRGFDKKALLTNDVCLSMNKSAFKKKGQKLWSQHAARPPKYAPKGWWHRSGKNIFPSVKFQILPRQHRHHDNPAVTANCTALAFNSITSVGAGAQWQAAHIQNERLSFAEARSDVCASVCFCNWVRVSVCVRGWSAKGLFIFSGNHYLDKLALMIHRIAVGGY